MNNPLSPLQGQVAVVTGGNRGIGAAIARKLAELGATVVIVGRDRASLDATARHIELRGGKVEACQFDISSLVDVEELTAFVGHTFGRIDILVNNAGVGVFGVPLHETSPEDWDRVMNTNLRGVFYCIRSFAPMMIHQKSGHIINISSIAAKNPVPNGAAYAATKWGLNGLSSSVAEELRGYDIRVSIVCPGSTDTELRRQAHGDVSKMLQPEDIAHAVGMLATQSPQSFVSEIVVRPTRKP